MRGKKNTEDKKLPLDYQIVAIQPFYVDRKTRPPIFHSPRCLSPNKQTSGKLHCNCFTNEQIKINMPNKQKSQQKSRPNFSKTMSQQWQKQATQAFKADLKQKLTEYYQSIKSQQKQFNYQVSGKQRRELQKNTNKMKKKHKLNLSSFQTVKRVTNSIGQTLSYKRDINTTILLNQNKSLYLFDSDQPEVLNRELRKKKELATVIKFTKNNKNIVGFQQVQQKKFDGEAKNIKLSKDKCPSSLQQKLRLFLTTHEEQYKDLQLMNKGNLEQTISKINTLILNKGDDLISQLIGLNANSVKFTKIIQGIISKLIVKQQTPTPSKSITPKEDVAFVVPNNNFVKSKNQNILVVKKVQHFQNNKPQITNQINDKSQHNQKAKVTLTKRNKDKLIQRIAYELVSNIGKFKAKGKQNMDEQQTKKEDKKIVKNQVQKLQKVEQTSFRQRKDNGKKSFGLNNKFKLGINYARVINNMLKNQVEGEQSPHKYRNLEDKRFRPVYMFKKNHLITEDEAESGEVQKRQKQKQTPFLVNKMLETSHIRFTKYEQARFLFNLRNNPNKLQKTEIPNNNLIVQNAITNSIKESQPRKLNWLNIQQRDHRNGEDNILLDYEDAEFEQIVLTQQQKSIKNLSQRHSKLSVKSRRLSGLKLSFDSDDEDSQFGLILGSYSKFDLQAVKLSITDYLKRLMKQNQKASELYSFLMFMEESRKVSIKKQYNHSSLNQGQIEAEQSNIREMVDQFQPKVPDFQGCKELFKQRNCGEKDLRVDNKKFFDKLDSRSFEIMHWTAGLELEQQNNNALIQIQLKQFIHLPK